MKLRTDEARSLLFDRLVARRGEIEQEALTRVYAIAEPPASDPIYAESLRKAVGAAIKYAFESFEHNDASTPPIHTALLSQARLAARGGIGLDTVLRRYFAGYTLLCDVLMQEVKADPALGPALRDVSRELATRFDRLVTAVTEEFTRELEMHAGTPGRQRARRIEQLLAGDLLDTSDLGYELNKWHIGVIAIGPQAGTGADQLRDCFDCRALLVRRDEDAIWLWLGTGDALDPSKLTEEAKRLSADICVAVGEPGRGPAGWRLTHRQAASALPVALRAPARAVRYADVALLASVLKDDVLATSLYQLYLQPLAARRDGGESLRQTLRAYFAAGRNVSSAAAILGVKRHTITQRLRTIEELIGFTVERHSAEIEAALQLDELED